MRSVILGGLTYDDACCQAGDDGERQSEPVVDAEQVKDGEGGHGDEQGRDICTYRQRAQQVAHGSALLGSDGEWILIEN